MKDRPRKIPPPPGGALGRQFRDSLLALKRLLVVAALSAGALVIAVTLIGQAFDIYASARLASAEAQFGGALREPEDRAGSLGGLDANLYWRATEAIIEPGPRDALATLEIPPPSETVDPAVFLPPSGINRWRAFVEGDGRAPLAYLHGFLAGLEGEDTHIPFNRSGSDDLIKCLVCESLHRAQSTGAKSALKPIEDGLRLVCLPESRPDAAALSARCRAVETLLSGGLSPLLGTLAFADEDLERLQGRLLETADKLPAGACLAGHLRKESAWYDGIIHGPKERILPGGWEDFVHSRLGGWLGRGFLKLAKAKLLRESAPLLETTDSPAALLSAAAAAEPAQGRYSTLFSAAGGFKAMRQQYANAALARAKLRAAATAVAALRYRRAKGRWPLLLDELVGDFIDEVPSDPFAGMPLLSRSDSHGFIVYSVGPNGLNDAGAPTLTPRAPSAAGAYWSPGLSPFTGDDVGLRIWMEQPDAVQPSGENNSNFPAGSGY